MNAETIFSVSNLLVLPQWMLLMAAPQWKWTHKLSRSFLIPLMLAVTYIFLLITHFSEDKNGGFVSLAEVKHFFSNEYMLLGGWIHYLAFDLIVGSWIAKNGQECGIKHWLLVPCLFFTYMLGPAGFVLYQLIKKYPSGL